MIVDLRRMIAFVFRRWDADGGDNDNGAHQHGCKLHADSLLGDQLLLYLSSHDIVLVLVGELTVRSRFRR